MKKGHLKVGSLAVIFSFSLALFVQGTVFAAGSAGIEVGLDSARALGKGNAVVADPEDASTLVYNPAGLAKLDGYQFVMNNTVLVPLMDYTNLDGYTEDGSTKVAVIPAFFMSLDTPIEKFKVGGGVNAPFGLANAYGSDGSFKYTGHSSTILGMYYTLDAAYQVAPWLSFGAGGSYVEGKVRQNNKLNSNFITLANGGPPGMPDANMETDVDGHAGGWNLGVLVTPNDKLDVGFFYRSQVRVPLTGELSVDNLQGPVMTAIFGGSSFNTSVDTDITFPDSAVIGVNYKATDKLDIEVDFGWTGWGKFDHFDFTYGTTNAVLSAGDPSEHKFADSISVNVGAEYAVNPNWDILAGYAFFEQAALEQDYSNVFQDGDRHNAAFGLQYHVNNVTIGVAYSAQFLTDMDVDNVVGSINNDTIDGTYSGFYHVIVSSVTVKI